MRCVTAVPPKEFSRTPSSTTCCNHLEPAMQKHAKAHKAALTKPSQVTSGPVAEGFLGTLVFAVCLATWMESVGEFGQFDWNLSLCLPLARVVCACMLQSRLHKGLGGATLDAVLSPRPRVPGVRVLDVKQPETPLNLDHRSESGKAKRSSKPECPSECSDMFRDVAEPCEVKKPKAAESKCRPSFMDCQACVLVALFTLVCCTSVCFWLGRLRADAAKMENHDRAEMSCMCDAATSYPKMFGLAAILREMLEAIRHRSIRRLRLLC